MPDKPHRSRAGWREMKNHPDDLVPGMPFHYHRPPKWIARCIIGLIVLGTLNLSGLALSLVYDIQQQQYILGRGEYRDREAERIEEQAQERIRAGMCDLLDQLPPSPLLDVPREKYGCGPGTPLAEFPPKVLEDLKNRGSMGLPIPPPLSVMPPGEGGTPPRTGLGPTD